MTQQATMGDKENRLPGALSASVSRESQQSPLIETLPENNEISTKESLETRVQMLAEAARNDHNVSARWDDLFEFQLQELRRSKKTEKKLDPCAEAESLTSELSILTQAQANNTHAKLNAWLALAAFTRSNCGVEAARYVFQLIADQRIGAYYRQLYETWATFEYACGDQVRGKVVLELGIRKKALNKQQAELVAGVPFPENATSGNSSSTSTFTFTSKRSNSALRRHSNDSDTVGITPQRESRISDPTGSRGVSIANRTVINSADLRPSYVTNRTATPSSFTPVSASNSQQKQQPNIENSEEKQRLRSNDTTSQMLTKSRSLGRSSHVTPRPMGTRVLPADSGSSLTARGDSATGTLLNENDEGSTGDMGTIGKDSSSKVIAKGTRTKHVVAAAVVSANKPSLSAAFGKLGAPVRVVRGESGRTQADNINSHKQKGDDDMENRSNLSNNEETEINVQRKRSFDEATESNQSIGNDSNGSLRLNTASIHHVSDNRISMQVGGMMLPLPGICEGVEPDNTDNTGVVMASVTATGQQHLQQKQHSYESNTNSNQSTTTYGDLSYIVNWVPPSRNEVKDEDSVGSVDQRAMQNLFHEQQAMHEDKRPRYNRSIGTSDVVVDDVLLPRLSANVSGKRLKRPEQSHRDQNGQYGHDREGGLENPIHVVGALGRNSSGSAISLSSDISKTSNSDVQMSGVDGMRIRTNAEAPTKYNQSQYQQNQDAGDGADSYISATSRGDHSNSLHSRNHNNNNSNDNNNNNNMNMNPPDMNSIDNNQKRASWSSVGSSTPSTAATPEETSPANPNAARSGTTQSAGYAAPNIGDNESVDTSVVEMPDLEPSLVQLVARKNVVTVNGVPYVRLATIGRGGSSKVYRVLSGDGRILALKRIKLQKTDRESLSPILNEIALLERLRGHPLIITLVDAQINLEKRFVAMVMEEGEIDLNHVMQERRRTEETNNNNNQGGCSSSSSVLPINFIRLTWMNMLEAVDALHEARIVHGDLKPANFLFVRGQLKLIDFGIARAISNDTTNIVRDTQVGTLNYMSPEAIADTSSVRNNPRGGPIVKLGRASDIWSLGCILYQMVYGRTPFADLKLIQKIRAITDANHQINFPALIPRNAALSDTMHKCLLREPSHRPPVQGSAGLLCHPFLDPEGQAHSCI